MKFLKALKPLFKFGKKLAEQELREEASEQFEKVAKKIGGKN